MRATQIVPNQQYRLRTSDQTVTAVRVETVPADETGAGTARVVVRDANGREGHMAPFDLVSLEAVHLQRVRHQRMLDQTHAEAEADPQWIAQESAHAGMLREISTPALVDMRYHAYETIAIVDSYGAACIWIDRLERELTDRGFILDAEVAFNAAYFEAGVRSAR